MTGDVVVAPDLDGDGTRDVVAVSLLGGEDAAAAGRARGPEPDRIYVDALSGKDGRQLWWWSVEADLYGSYRIRKLMWWGRGPDGWPLLAVPMGGLEDEERGNSERLSSETSPVVHLLEASTGRERHTVIGLADASLADLNGDGLADLWGEVNGNLRAFRGEAPEAWRALGRFRPAVSSNRKVDVVMGSVVDFDGDGIADTLNGRFAELKDAMDDKSCSQTAVARSGRDGHVIWKAVLDPWEHWLNPNCEDAYELNAFPLPAGDFDGDGTPDVIVSKDPPNMYDASPRTAATMPIQVLSGRTGARLWSAGRLPPEVDSKVFARVMWVEARAIETNGTPDLIVCHVGELGRPGQWIGSWPEHANPGGSVRPSRGSRARDGRISLGM